MKTRIEVRTLAVAVCLWSLSGALQSARADSHDTAPCVKADAELNRVYKKVRAMYKNDPTFLSQLKTAQRAWIKFRDAHLDARYPLEEGMNNHSSAVRDCICYELATVTRARTKQLKEWVTGMEEGDVCSGSLRLTPPK